jgi:hypothetical protein
MITLSSVTFQLFAAVIIKNAAFGDVAPLAESVTQPQTPAIPDTRLTRKPATYSIVHHITPTPCLHLSLCTPSNVPPLLILLVFLSSSLQLLVAANVVPRSLILFSLKMEAIPSSETWVLTRPARRHILDDDILHALSRFNRDCGSRVLSRAVNICRQD